VAIQENPYLPPQARVADAVIEAGDYIDGGRRVPVSHAWNWISLGWAIFRRQSGMWVLLTIVLGFIVIGLAVIPVLGSLAMTLLMPIFVGGLMRACRKIENADEIELADLFSAFKNHGGPLVLVGLIGLGLTIAVMIPTMVLVGVSGYLGASIGGNMAEAIGLGTIIGMLVFMALIIPVNMALWFAPSLVVFQGHGPTRAITQSFRGCLKNIVPFLLYGVILFVLAIFATIPLMLGWLVLAPVVIASVYAAYRDIFFER
jgi:uncharacterized membrane protein